MHTIEYHIFIKQKFIFPFVGSYMVVSFVLDVLFRDTQNLLIYSTISSPSFICSLRRISDLR